MHRKWDLIIKKTNRRKQKKIEKGRMKKKWML